MAKLTWQITTSVGTVTQDGPDLSDAQMQRFLDWLWYAYPQLDVDGNPLNRTNANQAQAFRDWADTAYQGTKANVLRWEKQEAAQAAAEAVTDIA